MPHFGGNTTDWIAKVKQNGYRLVSREILARDLEIEESNLSVSHYHVFDLEPPLPTSVIFITNDFPDRELKGSPLPIPLGKVFR